MRVPAPRRAWPPAVDLAVAAVTVAFLLAVSGQLEPGGGERAPDGAAAALAVVAGGALAFRRRRPAATVAVVTAAVAAYAAADYAGGPIYLTVWVALASLAATADRGQARAGGAAAAAVVIGAGQVGGGGPLLVHLFFVGWTAAAVLLGEAVRARRLHLAGLEERARRLEETREQEARRRVAEERLRIAQDLHDSVAHSMAAINVQAAAAARVLERRPAEARGALVAIQHASRDVLDELGALLAVLRVDPAEAGARAPSPDLARLGDLVASARLAGLAVAVEVAADLGPLPRPVELAAYRIVQESLTNVARHAGARTATVRVGPAGAGGLVVEVLDDGTGSAGGRPAGSGVGIVGMRERAEASGGHLEAGPRPGGGFAVRATWPARAGA